MTPLSSKRVVVMGLGRFGGGAGVTRFLVEQGARVLVTDLLVADKLTDSLALIDDLPVELRLGEHRVADFQDADLIVANPAVKPHGNVFFNAARDAGVPITSEIRLLVERLPNRQRTIGVTGTAGKSTVTAMIGHIFGSTPGPPGRRGVSKANPAGFHLGGNLGGSLLNNLNNIQSTDWIVLELSSFMLQGLKEDGWSPHVAVVTNFSPNHLDWHPTVDDYRAAKQAILAGQAPGDVAILGATAHWPVALGVQRHVIDDVAYELDLQVPGQHNLVNAMLALTVCESIALGGANLAGALADFPGLPHRLQLVAERDGVRYYNDSKCTTPQASQLAMECFIPGVVHAILGGYDKGADLKPLAGFATNHCKAVYAIGATAAAFDAIQCGTLERAMDQIRARVQPGDVVLLSPGCASWDQFDNYEQRGDRFTALAKGA